ncbi:hypothetical protein NQ284_27675, partial [Escherichia coli]|nr:hypothetical protein [Escherichia coli]
AAQCGDPGTAEPSPGGEKQGLTNPSTLRHAGRHGSHGSMKPVLAAETEQEVSSRLMRFLVGEAAGDDWERRRLRLLILQEEQRPGVMVHAMR